MGVHDTENYDKIRALLGIPADEPIFILRAKDRAAAMTVGDYDINANAVGASNEFCNQVRSCANDFLNFARDHADRMKVPD